jgi:hypothetical protein
LLYLLVTYATAYSVSPIESQSSTTLSRRSFGATVASALGSSNALSRSQAAVAKSDQEETDKQNILKGYVSVVDDVDKLSSSTHRSQFATANSTVKAHVPSR